MERRIIVIAGPSCSGKTKLGIKLAKSLGGEIISADSKQIYKYLDIGTAKPTKSELDKIKHHFISEIEPDANYNVSKFEKDANLRIEEIFNNNKIPIIVGGSGLYIKALTDGIVETPSKDEKLREKLVLEKEKFGNEFIYDKLKKVDPESAAKMHPSYWKRVIRALEVYYLTGKPISQFHKEQIDAHQYKFEEYVLNWPREILYKNIETRVDKMIESGFVNEVKIILNKGFSKNLNSLNTVGYKEIISYLENEISLERAIELIKRNTRRFAKRQLTWFRKNKNNHWVDIHSKKDLNIFMNKLLQESAK